MAKKLQPQIGQIQNQKTAVGLVKTNSFKKLISKKIFILDRTKLGVDFVPQVFINFLMAQK